jgi:hypothetical protein
MKESTNTQRPPTLLAPLQAPQHYLQPPPLAMLKNHIPHQGVMNTEKVINSSKPQMGQYPNLGPNQPKNMANHNILLTNKEEILMKNSGHQYGFPPEYIPTTSGKTLNTTRQPLMIPCPNNEPNPRIPCLPLRQNVHNPHVREAHNYSLVDDLAKSPTTMSVLEVLQKFPA